LVFALTAAVEDLVASRGDRRVGPVDAFFGGITMIKSDVRGRVIGLKVDVGLRCLGLEEVGRWRLEEAGRKMGVYYFNCD